MNADEFVHAIQNSEKGQVVIYDEAYTGLAARQALSKINKLIVSMMMEMRQKNLIVIIVLPTFFMLDRYVAVFRSVGLFHVYTHKGQRGFWIYFNKKNKKLLYIFGKKLMSYTQPRVNFRGRFSGKYVLDEEEYRRKKDIALKHRDGKERDDTHLINKIEYLTYLLIVMGKEGHYKSYMKVYNWLKQHNYTVKRTKLGDIHRKYCGNTPKVVPAP